MSVKTEDVNSNIVKKEFVEEETVLDNHALKVKKIVKTKKTYSLVACLKINRNFVREKCI